MVSGLIGQFGDIPRFAGWVLKKKKGKIEYRALVIGSYGVYTLKKKLIGGPEIARSGSLYDLKELSSDQDNHLKLTYEDWIFECVAPFINEAITAIRTSFALISVGYPEAERFRIVLPKERLGKLPIQADLKAGGFMETYRACCHLFGILPHDSFSTYMDGEINGTPNPHTMLDLSELPQISQSAKNPIDLRPIGRALRHNTHYKGLTIKSMVRKDAAVCLADALTFNTTLEVIRLVACEIGNTSKFAEALASNKKIAIREIDFSFSKLSDKQFIAILNGIKHFSEMHVLKFARCSLSSKSIAHLNSLIDTQKELASSFQELVFSHNDLSSGSGKEIIKLLTQIGRYLPSNKLRALGIAGIGVDVEKLAPAIETCTHLVAVDFSRTNFPKKAPTLVEMLSKSPNISELSFVGASMSADMIGAIVAAVLNNKKVANVKLNFSLQDLDEARMKSLRNAIDQSQARNLHSLLLKSAKFKIDHLVVLVHSIVSAHPNFAALNINSTIRRKANSVQLASAIASLLTNCKGFESLQIAGDGSDFYMGETIRPILEVLPKSSIIDLDISDNEMCAGKTNTVMDTFSEVLTRTKELASLRWDGNKTSYHGFNLFRKAMEKNKSLIVMPFPQSDFSAAYKAEKSSRPRKQKAEVDTETTETLKAISDALRRNKNSTKKNPRHSSFHIRAYYQPADHSAPPPLPTGDTSKMHLMQPTLLTVFEPDAENHKPSTYIGGKQVDARGRAIDPSKFAPVTPVTRDDDDDQPPALPTTPTSESDTKKVKIGTVEKQGFNPAAPTAVVGSSVKNPGPQQLVNKNGGNNHKQAPAKKEDKQSSNPLKRLSARLGGSNRQDKTTKPPQTNNNHHGKPAPTGKITSGGAVKGNVGSAAAILNSAAAAGGGSKRKPRARPDRVSSSSKRGGSRSRGGSRGRDGSRGRGKSADRKVTFK